MAAFEEFKNKFSQNYIKQYYSENVKYKSTPGMDKINVKSFEENIDRYAEIIYRKVNNRTYRFTPYKMKLISKGPNKNPRKISIPTIRDKVTLGILKEIIFNSFSNQINTILVQTLIAEITQGINSGNCDYFIKIDVRNFFGSINHDLLFKQVKKKIRKKEVLSLIGKAIKTPTITDFGSRKNQEVQNITGVPQGLPISNLLSSIYLYEFDEKHKESEGYIYYRYVDDILILCKEEEHQSIKQKIKEDMEKLKLEINLDKDDSGNLKEGLSYLGYVIDDEKISIRDSSIHKIEYALETMFVEFKHSGFDNVEYFVWRLNLRITGCVKDNKKYGWVFFFSQIDKLEILFKLDWLVGNLIDRFSLTNKLENYQIKKFIRTYHEIRKNLYGTNYLPKFDEYSSGDKEKFVTNILKKDISGWTDKEIDGEFNKNIFANIRDLDKDIQDFS